MQSVKRLEHQKRGFWLPGGPDPPPPRDYEFADVHPRPLYSLEHC